VLKDKREEVQTHIGFLVPIAGDSGDRSRLWCLLGLGGMMDNNPSPVGGFFVLFKDSSNGWSEDSDIWRKNKVLPPYPRSGGAPSAGGGCVSLCV
jgi:hypothetical protein